MRSSRALPALGVAVIWLFLALFLVYPLTRIFYDAVTDEAGRLTVSNFAAFFTDSFYLRALWKSLVLGVATVAASSVIGITVAFLLVRYDFRSSRSISSTASTASCWSRRSTSSR